MLDPQPLLPEAFGSWKVTSPPVAGDLSFTAPQMGSHPTGPGPAAGLVWSKDLPADPRAARHELERMAMQVRTASQKLDTAGGRIDSLVQMVRSETRGLAFTAVASPELAPPEAQALKLLDSLEYRSKNEGQYPTSYGLELLTGSDWEGAAGQFQAALDRLLHFILHLAWVETQVEGAFLARTILSWTGKMDTCWGSSASGDQYRLHTASLETALSSRFGLLRTFAVTAQSAVKLSFLLSTPGGALLALPVAWKFIAQVLSEVDDHQLRKSSTSSRTP